VGMGPNELTKARIKWFPPTPQTPSVPWSRTLCDGPGAGETDMSDLRTTGHTARPTLNE